MTGNRGISRRQWLEQTSVALIGNSTLVTTDLARAQTLAPTLMNEPTHRSDHAILEQLATFVHGLTIADLPEPVIAKAENCLMDLLGVTFAVLKGSGAQALRRYAAALNPTPAATLWGTRQMAGIAETALVHGALGYEAEFDDGVSLGGHWGSSSIPAIIALAERGGQSASDIIVAIVAAYEVATRISRIVAAGLLKKGVHYPGLMGAIAATAGCAKIMGLDVKQITGAFGHLGLVPVAPYFAGHSGTDTKNLYSGWPNLAGIQFTALAKAGYYGPPDLLEGRDGLAQVLGWSGSEAELAQKATQGLGQDFAILQTYFKPYPCNRWVHAPVQGVLGLLSKQEFTSAQIDRITVKGPTFLAMYNTKQPYETPLQGKYSLPYCVAAAAMTGSLGLTAFESSMLNDPAILALTDRVQFAVDPDLDKAFPANFATTVEVILRDGRHFGSRDELPWGPKNAPDFVALSGKFRALMERACAPTVVDRWVRYFSNGLRHHPNPRQIFRLLQDSRLV